MNLVNDILDLHQMQAKELRIVNTASSIREVCEQSLSVIQFKAAFKGIDVRLEIDKSVPARIETDANRLRQILVNLLSNALKFTEKGFIEISVTLLEKALVRFAVKDSGIGIKKENLNKLFKTFGKLDLGEQNTMNPQGVGLGLCISHRLAQRLNPDIGEGAEEWTDSGVGVRLRGTEFAFTVQNTKLMNGGDSFDEEDDPVNKKMAMINKTGINSRFSEYYVDQ